MAAAALLSRNRKAIPWRTVAIGLGLQVLTALFVLRCSGAATGAYLLANSLGLQQALWAAMTAVIVSQEEVAKTRAASGWRIAGTTLGIIVSVAVGALAAEIGASRELQVAVAVGLCALIVRRAPLVRVAMWTCPLILLSAQPVDSIVSVALRRGCEVALGAAVGWSFHVTAARAEQALRRLRRSGRSEPTPSDGIRPLLLR